MEQTTCNSLIIKAAPEKVYDAFINPSALEIWQAPESMTARIHSFNLAVGGSYEMSLFYSRNKQLYGKTNDKEDRYTARFLELIPNEKIVEAINFKTTNPDFLGQMIMEIMLEPIENGTNVTILFKNIPRGIKPEDNEAGTNSSLKNLAKYVENE